MISPRSWLSSRNNPDWRATGAPVSASLATGLSLLLGLGVLAVLGEAEQTLWDRLSNTCVYRVDEPTEAAYKFSRQPGKVPQRSPVAQQMPRGRRW